MNGELLEEINLPKKMAETIVDKCINNNILKNLKNVEKK